MGEPAKKADDLVAVPADDFRRMVTALEMVTRQLALITQYEERRLAQAQDTARRAAIKAGPTTDEARAKIERMRGKLGL
jgi:hypothetical protein